MTVTVMVMVTEVVIMGTDVDDKGLGFIASVRHMKRLHHPL